MKELVFCFVLVQGIYTLEDVMAVLNLHGSLNSKPSRGLQIIVPPRKTLTLTYEKYNTTSLVCLRKGLYLFSNGYLTTIIKDNDVTASVSENYTVLTFKSSSGEYLHGTILLEDIAPVVATA